MGLLSRLLGAAAPVRPAPLQDGLGLFGKLPASGDFVHLGIERALRERLDDWLSRGMLALNAQADGLQQYLVVPAWCGLLPAGLLDDSQLGLVLMPSVDRVGRYFPLCALLEAPAEDPQSGLAARLQAAARELPRALREPLDVHALRDTLLRAVAIAPAFEPPLRAAANAALWWPSLNGAAPFSHAGGLDESLFLRVLGAAQEAT